MAEAAVSTSVLRRDGDVTGNLPYARHVNERVIALDGGALMVAFELEGASFETADVRELNDRHSKLNSAWRNLCDDQLAVWTHLVRTEAEEIPNGAFSSDFAATLDSRFRARLAGERLYTNRLFLTLVARPGAETSTSKAALQGLLSARRGSPCDDPERLRRLDEAAQNLVQYLGRYRPRPLGIVERRELWFSEPLEMLQLILSGQKLQAPLVHGHLGRSLYGSRIIFGREALEIRDVGGARFAGILGVKEYPATTRPGLWDGILKAPFPLVLSQSFAFLSRAAARTVMERKQNQMTSARDRATSQVHALGDALDDLMSNRFVMGDHQMSLLVYGEHAPELARNMARARASLADSGMVVAREDLALEAAFWSQFPGAFRKRPRPAAITSRNFAALAPLNAYPSGRPMGNHWGPAVTRLGTSAKSPYFFNFHVADLGHTFICGPSGSGKTVVQNFLLAQLEKLGAQQIFIDKDRGAEIFVRACGGRYLALRNGEPTGLAPFKSLELTPQNRAFLGKLVRRLVTPEDRPLEPEEEVRIDEGILALSPLPRSERSLAALRALLGQKGAGGVGARLQKWCAGGALGWVLDNPEDRVSLEDRFIGFDMTDFLDNPEVRTPVMMTLVHKISSRLDGRRLVVDIDEFWKALGDDAFLDLAEDGLKTYRKQNAFMVFGTQSPADALRSRIAHTIVEMCATKIFLPNPFGTERDYVEGFGLSAREFQLIREELLPASRQFLVKQGHDSAVVELNLDGLEDELAVLSGRSDTVALLDRIRAEVGDDPAVWLPVFQRERRTLP